MTLLRFLIIICIAGGVWSCSDFLEVSPRDQLSDDTFWQNEGDAKLALIGLYDVWGGQGNGDDGFPYSFFLYFADSWSDDAYNQFGGWYETFAQGNISPADPDLASRYAELYQIIRRCNVFLAHIDEPEMDEALRNTMKSEARFIRAYQYFLIFYHWGEAQLTDTPLSPDRQNVSRGDEGETAAFILEDLQFAIDNLPVVHEEGRIDKGAAMGLRSRVLLYEASPFSNPENDLSKWRDAAEAARAVMELGQYALFRTEAGDGYAELFDSENENNNEVIFDRENHDIPGLGNQLVRLLSINPSATTFLVPTQSLVDSYATYDPDTDQLVPFDPANPFENRDPRLDFSIGHHGSEYYGTTLDIDGSPLLKSVTGYGIVKFLTDEFDPNNPVGNGNDSPVNHILMRYSEILLNYAEAKTEANEIDQSVIDAINEVRARAYGVDRTDIEAYPEVIITDQASLRQIVRNERRVELALEGLRWYDIRRWETAEIVRNQTLSGARGDIINREFDASKDYFWPIPQREIDLLDPGVLEQNLNY